MFLQYGELRPTSGWDRLTSLGYPCTFLLVPRLGSVTARHLVVGVSQTLRRWTEGATYIRQGDHQVGHWPTFLVFVFPQRCCKNTASRFVCNNQLEFTTYHVVKNNIPVPVLLAVAYFSNDSSFALKLISVLCKTTAKLVKVVLNSSQFQPKTFPIKNFDQLL